MAEIPPSGQLGLTDTSTSEPRALLMACGILQIVIGMIGLVTFFVALRIILISTDWHLLQALPMIYALLIYLFFCICPVATGLDSLRLRPWVCPVVLGLVRPMTLALTLILCLGLYASSTQHEDSSYILAAGGAFFILLPSALLQVIYRRADIHELLIADQPDLAWTEQPPESLFELSLWLTLAAACLLFPMTLTLAAPATPDSLLYLPIPSMAMSLLLAGIGLACLVAAILCFNQHIAGWYLALALNIALLIALASPLISGIGLPVPPNMGDFLPSPMLNALIALCIPAIALLRIFKSRPDFFIDDTDLSAD